MLFWLDILWDNLVHPCNTPAAERSYVLGERSLLKESRRNQLQQDLVGAFGNHVEGGCAYQTDLDVEADLLEARHIRQVALGQE